MTWPNPRIDLDWSGFGNYDTQSLAHQIARSIACDIALDGAVREIEYLCADRPDSNGHAVSDSAVIMRFTNNMQVRIVDLRHPPEHGVWVADFGADGEIYNYGRRYYRRSDYPDHTDAQWRDAIVAHIASDCSDIAALRGVATQSNSV